VEQTGDELEWVQCQVDNTW